MEAFLSFLGGGNALSRDKRALKIHRKDVNASNAYPRYGVERIL